MNRFNAAIHHRRSIRLKGYDYASPGAYFVTVCAHNRKCLFGEIIASHLQMNEYGQVVHAEWLKTIEIEGKLIWANL